MGMKRDFLAELAAFGGDWMCGEGMEGRHSGSEQCEFGYLGNKAFHSSYKKNMLFT